MIRSAFRASATCVRWSSRRAPPAEAAPGVAAVRAGDRRRRDASGLRGAVGGIWMLFTALYLLISFTTHAWHITWILFSDCPAVINILNAVLDAKSRPGPDAAQPSRRSGF